MGCTPSKRDGFDPNTLPEGWGQTVLDLSTPPTTTDTNEPERIKNQAPPASNNGKGTLGLAPMIPPQIYKPPKYTPKKTTEQQKVETTRSNDFQNDPMISPQRGHPSPHTSSKNRVSSNHIYIYQPLHITSIFFATFDLDGSDFF